MTLTELKIIADQLAAKINAPLDELPTFGPPTGDGTPNIEIDDQGLFHYVMSERGEEYDRMTTAELDEVLYWIFSDVSFKMAVNFERENRIETQDFRRLVYAKHIDLLVRLNKEWEHRGRKEHQTFLSNNPFDDLSGLRAAYYRELRETGLSESEIQKLAVAKYPRK